jgi:hypothetical protein
MQAQNPGRGPYVVKLLYASQPPLDIAALHARLQGVLGNVDIAGTGPQSTLFAARERGVTLPDGQRAPVMLSVATADVGDLEASLGQSWDWDLARDVTSRASHALAVHDLVTLGLDSGPRLEFYDLFLRAVLEEAPPIAMHWLASERIVEPREYLETTGVERLTKGYINVRLFRVENRSAGECVMDTLGLAAFGLPDLQCHFAALDPRTVARVLFNTAAYVFERGDVLEDGHTVEGTVPGSRWRCQHEMSLVAPERAVVDLHPGAARPR